MDTIFLRKYALWPVLCIILFLIFIKQGKLSNSSYNENVKRQSYSVKVISIKKAREYYISGIDTNGYLIELVISPKWNLHTVQVGDSVIKKANSYEIRVVMKQKSIILTPELPL
jgi:hypothetical protein